MKLSQCSNFEVWKTLCSDFSDLGWKTLYLEFQEDVQDFRIISENWEPYENLAVIQKTANASSSETDEI